MRTIALAAFLLTTSTVLANATPITVDGTYTVSTSGATVADSLSSPFSLNLTLNIPDPVNLANIVQPDPAKGDTVTSNVITSFTFTSGVVGNASLTAQDVISRDGNSSNFMDTLGSVPLTTFDLSDGSILDLTFTGGSFNGSNNGITPTMTFDLVQGPTDAAVPEPATLSLFGAGIAGLGSLLMLRRRRQNSA